MSKHTVDAIFITMIFITFFVCIGDPDILDGLIKQVLK